MKQQVLVMDSDLDMCKEIKDSLQSETLEVFYTTSGKEGFELFTKQHFSFGNVAGVRAVPLNAGVDGGW